jgi:hypothetical protein
METALFNNHEILQFEEPFQSNLISTDKPFIEANTIANSLEEIKSSHVIPVFVKDNEPVISHADFIESTYEVVSEIYSGETILKPSKEELRMQNISPLSSFWSMKKRFIMSEWHSLLKFLLFRMKLAAICFPSPLVA